MSKIRATCLECRAIFQADDGDPPGLCPACAERKAGAITTEYLGTESSPAGSALSFAEQPLTQEQGPPARQVPLKETLAVPGYVILAELGRGPGSDSL